jgi:hypothetical protein
MYTAAFRALGQEEAIGKERIRPRGETFGSRGCCIAAPQARMAGGCVSRPASGVFRGRVGWSHGLMASWSHNPTALQAVQNPIYREYSAPIGREVRRGCFSRDLDNNTRDHGKHPVEDAIQEHSN